MTTDPPRPVPTTVVAGFLGVGKTTAILDLAGHRPDAARWIVLVNEFGEVGIDGAVLSDDADLGVRELPGGCLCCTAKGPMEGSVRRIVSELAPDRLLIEPSGVADAGALVDLLTGPLGPLLDLRATLTLVDPRDVGRAGMRHRPAWQSQVDAADVLVGNRVDRCTPTEVRDFLAWADGLWPPKRVVSTTVGGELDPAWLDWPAQPRPRQVAAHGLPDGARWVDQTGLLPDALGRRLFRRAAAGPDFRTCGWTGSADEVHDAGALADLLAELATHALRVKGVFRTPTDWRVAQADRDGVRWTPTGWRRDNRLEVIVEPEDPLTREALARRLAACRVDG